jgi:hypothetical protein
LRRLFTHRQEKTRSPCRQRPLRGDSPLDEVELFHLPDVAGDALDVGGIIAVQPIPDLAQRSELYR